MHACLTTTAKFMKSKLACGIYHQFEFSPVSSCHFCVNLKSQVGGNLIP
jgi:hypothetical protein